MRILTAGIRILLGVIFLFAGLNHLFNFAPGPMPSGTAGQFLAAMTAVKYFYVVGVCEAVPGLLLIINRFVPLTLLILAAVIVNIDFVDFSIAHFGIPSGVLVTILWLYVAYRYRSALSGVIQARAETN
jgi:putative oxidoreductase